MERTLFGIIETRTEQRDRAKKLAALYASLRDAPGAIECRTQQAKDLNYFIDRSRRRRMDPNDWDGLHRLIGDPEELITDGEARAHARNPKNWKPIKYGFLHFPPGTKWICCMHRKEVAYLEHERDVLRDEIVAIESSVSEIQEEARLLREIGPLPKEIAERHGLTEDGQPKPKEEHKKRI